MSEAVREMTSDEQIANFTMALFRLFLKVWKMNYN